MLRFLPKLLFLSSIVAFAISACSPALGYKTKPSKIITKNEIHPIINDTAASIFKARIKVYQRSFSGLIVLKKTDTTTSHLTFITEIGMKMFDFEIKDNSFKLIYIFDPLNKPNIIKLLENDMQLLLLHQAFGASAEVFEKNNIFVYKIKKNDRYYFKVNANNTIHSIVKKGPLFSKEKVKYSYRDSFFPQNIKLKHCGLVSVKIELNKIVKLNE